MEWFDLMDATGRKTGEKKEREAVHRDGDWHQSVHVWVIRNGEVLLQKRAADKECFPGCWDAACTGHVSAGEDILEGALRELREEIGVQAKPEALRYLFTQQLCVHSGAFCSNEWNDVFLLDPAELPEKLQLQREEISAVKWMDAALLGERILMHDPLYCMSAEEYRQVYRQYSQLSREAL